MKKMTIVVALMAIFGGIHAQNNYKQAIGARISPLSDYDIFSGSYKVFLAEPSAIELNAGFGGNRDYVLGTSYRSSSFSVSAAYQHHFEIAKVNGLKWFIGGGGTIFHTASTYKNSGYKGTGVGLFPTGGADYKFKKIPLNVSADWRPTFLATAPNAYNSFLGDRFGLAARYTF